MIQSIQFEIPHGDDGSLLQGYFRYFIANLKGFISIIKIFFNLI